jgi:hypothetical protein
MYTRSLRAPPRDPTYSLSPSPGPLRPPRSPCQREGESRPAPSPSEGEGWGEGELTHRAAKKSCEFGTQRIEIKGVNVV